MLAVIVGILAAMVFYARLREWLVLRDLSSDDPALRAGATHRAAAIAARSARMLRCLEQALKTDDDRVFAAAATALDELGRFHTPQRDPAQIDRLRAIDLEAAGRAGPQAAISRSMILTELILCGRDNRHVRRAAALAAGDAEPAIRELAAVLAARIADDTTLSRLLADRDAGVAAAAALDAGLARREDLADPIAELLAASEDTDVVSSAAYATALLGGRERASLLAAQLRRAKDGQLRDRLLHVMAVAAGESAAEAVATILEQFDVDGTHPPAAALLAAGKLGLKQVAPHIRKVLADSIKADGKLTVAQVMAALQAADALGLDVRAEVDAICRNLWSKEYERLMAAAAEILGRQIEKSTAGREGAIRTLRRAALYDPGPESVPTASAPQVATTPVASAAAAAALWQIQPGQEDTPETRTHGADSASAAWLVRVAAGAAEPAAGDCIAWRIGRSGRGEAFALGLSLLPALDAHPPRKVFNDNARAAGAMLLALSADTDQRARKARQRISSRLEGGALGGEDQPTVAFSYECALLILGELERAEKIKYLLEQGALPPRRAVTALCAAGDRAGLDWLLWSLQVTPEQAIALLVDSGLAEVIAVVAPELPAVDAAAEPDLQRWQLRILQEYYAIHRSRLRLGLVR